MSVCVCVCVCVCLCVFVCLYVYLSVYLSVYFSTWQCFNMPFGISFYFMLACLPTCLPVFLSACLSDFRCHHHHCFHLHCSHRLHQNHLHQHTCVFLRCSGISGLVGCSSFYFTILTYESSSWSFVFFQFHLLFASSFPYFLSCFDVFFGLITLGIYHSVVYDALVKRLTAQPLISTSFPVNDFIIIIFIDANFQSFNPKQLTNSH